MTRRELVAYILGIVSGVVGTWLVVEIAWRAAMSASGW